MANETEYTSVAMEDGTELKFPMKRNVLKDTVIDGDSVTLTMKFKNGAVRSFVMNSALLMTFAAHGMESKYGDEMAGLKDIEDMVLAVEDLHKRLETGAWGVKRESNGMAGTSVLARALVEHSGKPIEVIKDFLAKKDNAQKLALRTHPDLAPIIARIEAERGGKKAKSTIDAGALLNELEPVVGEEHHKKEHKHKA